MNGRKGILIALVAVLIIAAGTYWYMNRVDDSMAALVEEANAVLIQNQPSGTETVVTYARLSEPGYVVIYSIDASGNRSQLGASALLSAGEHRNVRVTHRGGSRSSGSVAATVVADNGDGTYTEEDTEVLVEETDPGASAVIDESAVLDADLTDEELAHLLEDAGYTVDEDVVVADEEHMEAETETEAAPEETPEAPATGDEVTVEADATTQVEATVE